MESYQTATQLALDLYLTPTVVPVRVPSMYQIIEIFNPLRYLKQFNCVQNNKLTRLNMLPMIYSFRNCMYKQTGFGIK